MATRTETAVDRRRRRVAASYRGRGYSVIMPLVAGALPAFLHDCHPDLIAEKDDDRVVIEIKPSRALKGGNDLTALAARVEAEPGWRLELVALTDQDEATPVLAPDWLEYMLRPGTPATDDTLRWVYLTEVLDALIHGVALHNGLRLRDRSTTPVARELAFAGVIGQDLLARIELTLEWRNSLMHRLPVARTAADQAAEVETLCRDLQTQSQQPED